MQTTIKIITILLGLGMLIPGLTKFFSKFHSHFEQQIELSGLPFPQLSFYAGQSGLLVVGIVLLSLGFFWNQWQDQVASKVFVLANIMVFPIFLVAVYVHLHPDVPAEILPFESKPPTMAIVFMVMAAFNLFMSTNKKHTIA